MALILLLLYVPLQNVTSQSSRKRFILISWDGVEREVFYELLNSGQLPNIASLPTIGNLTDNWWGNTKLDKWVMTSTKPQHAIMLTGYLADVTGVYGNNLPKWQPIPDGLTVFERLKGLEGFYTVLIATKPDNVCNPDFFSYSLGEIDFWGCEDWRAPDIYPLMEDQLYGNYDKNFFMFFHFKDPDGAGHWSGVNSPNYRRAIKRVDMVLGWIMEDLKDLGVYDETALLVTSDHGFGCPSETSHWKCSPNTFFATNLPVADLQWMMIDVAPTIYKYFEIPLLQGEPKLAE